MKYRVLYMAVALLAVAGQATAATSISTLPFGGEVASFGEPGTATYGQTITVPAVDNVLDSFSFWLNDNLNPDYVDFAGYVMAWDGVKATGSVLWNSAPLTTTNHGGSDGFEKFTFNASGLALTPSAQYVLFINASNFFDGSQGNANSIFGSTPYAGGGFFFMDNGADFSALTASSWADVYSSLDMAFEAEFSSAGAVVPAPGAILLGSLGAGLVHWLRRRRTL